MPNRIRRFFGLAARHAEHHSHEVVCDNQQADESQHLAALVFCAALPEDGSVPEWIDILPLGDFSARDGRGPFHADGAAVIAATQANGLDRGLPIDYDHRTFVADDSRAAGWIREVKIEGTVLKARVEWTPAARKAIENKEYRFISPVFRCKPDDPDAPKDEVSGRVLYIRGAGLVNDPALDMTAILSASRTVSMKNKNMKMSEVCAALEKAFPKHSPAQIQELAAHAAQMQDGEDVQNDAEDGDGNDGGDQDMSADNPYAGETEAQARERHVTMATKRVADKVAETAEQKAQREAKEASEILAAHQHDEEAREARAARGTRTVTRTVRMTEGDVAKHPLVVKLARQVGDLTAAREKEKAQATIAEALKARKILPAQREWALAYCSSDPAGFALFIKNEPVKIAEQDGSFRGVPESRGDNTALSATDELLCEMHGYDREVFAKNKAKVIAGTLLPKHKMLAASEAAAAV